MTRRLSESRKTCPPCWMRLWRAPRHPRRSLAGTRTGTKTRTGRQERRGKRRRPKGRKRRRTIAVTAPTRRIRWRRRRHEKAAAAEIEKNAAVRGKRSAAALLRRTEARAGTRARARARARNEAASGTRARTGISEAGTGETEVEAVTRAGTEGVLEADAEVGTRAETEEIRAGKGGVPEVAAGAEADVAEATTEQSLQSQCRLGGVMLQLRSRMLRLPRTSDLATGCVPSAASTTTGRNQHALSVAPPSRRRAARPQRLRRATRTSHGKSPSGTRRGRRVCRPGWQT